MIKSMTGFGRSEGETSLGKVSVECRSVNHRYCDINIKLPRLLVPFEARIKELMRLEVSRGRIDLSVKLDHTGDGRSQLSVDFDLAEQYKGALRSLKERLDLQGEMTLELFVGAKDLITAKEEIEDVEPYWPGILPIVRQSLREMDNMKCSEGQALTKDLEQRSARVTRELQEIRNRFPSCMEAYQGRLRERLRALLDGTDVDSFRFQQEISFLTERTDITEEIVRATSHLCQFAALLEGKEPVGRKMDFLLQEIHREVNTISAKANDAEISQRVIEIKGELEKIREQVQNIE